MRISTYIVVCLNIGISLPVWNTVAWNYDLLENHFVLNSPNPALYMKCSLAPREKAAIQFFSFADVYSGLKANRVFIILVWLNNNSD